MKRLRNSVIKWLVVALLFLLLGFLLGKFKQELLVDKISLMTFDLATMKTRNSSLEIDISKLEIESISNKQTIKSLISTNKDLQNELSSLNNKLFFYKRVLSPELEKKGVKVHSFEISENRETGNWDYELVLMQSQKERRMLKGKLDIYLSIFEGDKLKKIPLSTFTESPHVSFKFKYFQTILGSFSLPTDTSVDEVILQLSVAGNRWYKAQNLDERYDWRVLTTHDQGELNEFESSENESHNK